MELDRNDHLKEYTLLFSFAKTDMWLCSGDFSAVRAAAKEGCEGTILFKMGETKWFHNPVFIINATKCQNVVWHPRGMSRHPQKPYQFLVAFKNVPSPIPMSLDLNLHLRKYL